MVKAAVLVSLALLASPVRADWIMYAPNSHSRDVRWSKGLCESGSKLSRCNSRETSETQWLEIDADVKPPGPKAFADRESTLSVLPAFILDGPAAEADFRRLKAVAYVQAGSNTWVRWTEMKPSPVTTADRGGATVGGTFLRHSGTFECAGRENDLVSKFGRFPERVRVRIELPADDPPAILSVMGPVITDDNQDGVYRVKQ